MLNCVATMAGQEQFYFFLLLLNNGYRVFSYHGDVKEPISRDSWGLSVSFFMCELYDIIVGYYNDQ